MRTKLNQDPNDLNVEDNTLKKQILKFLSKYCREECGADRPEHVLIQLGN